MPFDVHRNFAFSTVAVAPSPATTGLTFTVASGHGSRFAVDMKIVVAPPGTPPDYGNAEITKVANIAGDVLTLTARGISPSSARAISVGDQVFSPILQDYLEALEAAIGTGTGGSADILQTRLTDPSSPADGDLWAIVADQGGGVWSLEFRSKLGGAIRKLPIGDMT